MRPAPAIAACALLALAACDGTPDPGPSPRRPRFAFVTNNFSPFWVIAQKGLEKAKQELGVDVEFRAPQNGKLEEQRRILEDLLAQGVDGIAVSPIDSESDDMIDLLNRAAARVPLICHDSDAPKSNRLCYIGTDNLKAGRESGKAMKEALGEAGGKVALFVGRLDAQNAQERRQGFLDEVKGSKIELVKDFLDYADPEKARRNAEEALAAIPDVAALLGLWGYNGPRLAAAIRGAGKTGRVKGVCFDEDDATLQAVRDGVLFATIVQKPFEFGYQSMKVLRAAREGRTAGVIPPGRIIDTGVETIRKENVEAFWTKLKELSK
jgi:ribose transport system substrate-binding protein